jgi:hypothetical protein
MKTLSNGNLLEIFGPRFSDEILLSLVSEQMLEEHISRGKQPNLYPEEYDPSLEARSASKRIYDRWRSLRQGSSKSALVDKKTIKKGEKKNKKL